MSVQYILDTHTLLWYVADDPRLGKNACAILDDPTSELLLPAIVLAEACFIVEQGKVALGLDGLLEAINSDIRITFVPLDRVIIERTTLLSAIREMHDRQIVATALVLADQGDDVVMLTRDQNITTSGLGKVMW